MLTVREKGKLNPFTIVSEQCQDIVKEICKVYQAICIQFPPSHLVKINAAGFSIDSNCKVHKVLSFQV